jgi:hypothetical protein
MKLPTMLLILFLGLVAALAGCSAGKRFDAPQPGEIPPGPGVFTKGEDGAVLYDSKGGGLVQPGSQAHPPPSSEKRLSGSSTADFEAFEAFRQWDAWRRDPQNAKEYEEFKQWLEWKRYQQWKRGQTNQP